MASQISVMLIWGYHRRSIEVTTASQQTCPRGGELLPSIYIIRRIVTNQHMKEANVKIKRHTFGGGYHPGDSRGGIPPKPDK